ncbi:MAG: GTP cyclohydrolase I FolE [Myxococcales bacterium]|nr:MAG: GTP cyclohydrolase I FolE [Myxococcales bacterium]
MDRNDETRIQEAAGHLRKAFGALGLPIDSDPEMAETPSRIARMLTQVFRGLDAQTAPTISVTSFNDANMVLLRGLPFYSMCAHHFLPFFGQADIAYIPDRKVVGFGAFPNALDHFARRPQLQERLAEQMADWLVERLDPKGVVIHLMARQLCMEMRGAAKPGWIEYTAARGAFVEGERREEFFRRLATPVQTPY